LDFDDSNGQVRYQHLNIGYISTYQSSHQKNLMPDSSNWTHILIKYESTPYQLNQLSLIELFSLTAGLRCTILSVHNPNKLLDNYLKLLFFLFFLFYKTKLLLLVWTFSCLLRSLTSDMSWLGQEFISEWQFSFYKMVL
jgi:hypothetical protein